MILKILLNRLNLKKKKKQKTKLESVLFQSYFPLQFFAFKVAVGMNVGLRVTSLQYCSTCFSTGVTNFLKLKVLGI